LGVLLTPEHERGESFYNDRLAEVVSELTDKGIAEESEGAIVVFTKGQPAPLIVQKSDGGFGYGTTDLAAVKFRIQDLHADRVVYFVDARQSQHFAQVFDAARRAGWADKTSLEHAAFGTMLGPDGKPFKTKTGGTVKLKDLLDEGTDRAFKLVTDRSPEVPEDRRRAIAERVGIGAIKYADLAKDRISDYAFSFDAMLSLDGNTAPYLQYAYARIQSIFRKAAGSASNGTIKLDAPHEIALAKQILRLGEVIELVAKDLKPHLLCQFLYDLATKFSGFYENCPVLSSEEPIRSSRLALCKFTADTMATGLDLLGIEHPDQM
jgi:arginyl-tRNA synthetase